MRHSARATMLPDRDVLLAAFRGLPHDDHPILDAAGELALLHQLRDRIPRGEAERIDRRRAQLMRSIDRWVILAAPVPPAAADEHSETLGDLVDRLAMHSAQAFVVLAGAPESVFYDEWVRLDDLADSYQRLIDDLWAGVRSLPAYTY
ncbi:hypothetical protein BOX37_21425 [Nocardia mangyaensis]|uniref:DUF4254 domain-containing protein n=1 Tax=Nocardia mangyaensis TaxID=2213200 RepID=A0A1J0VVH1_9NOCA|nr:DUF4254 domain-containing protein [Nocardia mangyaensis]APE36064.1 hypothetical protein BOX37_21425 [Nocardia mangyaensis]